MKKITASLFFILAAQTILFAQAIQRTYWTTNLLSAPSGITNIIDTSDIVYDKVYTNTSGSNLLVTASMSQATTISGYILGGLKIDNNADGSYETFIQCGGNVFATTGLYTNQVSGTVLQGGRYYFTNSIGGGGGTDAGAIISGSCQRVYSPAAQVIVSGVASAVPSSTGLMKGNGSGGLTDSGLSPSSVVTFSGVWYETNGVLNKAQNFDSAVSSILNKPNSCIYIGIGDFNFTNTCYLTNGSMVLGSGMEKSRLFYYGTNGLPAFEMFGNTTIKNFSFNFAPLDWFLTNYCSFAGNSISGSTYDNIVISGVKMTNGTTDCVYFNKGSGTNILIENSYLQSQWDQIAFVTGSVGSGELKDSVLVGIGPNQIPTFQNLSRGVVLNSASDYWLSRNTKFYMQNTNAYAAYATLGQLAFVGCTFTNIPLSGGLITNIYNNGGFASGASVTVIGCYGLDPTQIYVKSSNGAKVTAFLNQAGTTNLTSATSFTATFSCPMPDTNYVSSLIGNSAAVSGVYVTSKTVNSCIFNFASFSGTVDWSIVHQ